MPASTVNRRFVPADFDPSDFSQIEPLYRRLLDRPLDSAADLERWLLDLTELSAAVDEFGARRYIDKSCHTDDPAIEKAFMHYVENIEPRIKPLFFQIQKKYLQSPSRSELADPKFALLERRWRSDVELFREENIPLEVQITRLVTEYDRINGDMTVEFDGQELTLPQLGRFMDSPDRATRMRAWEAANNRRLRDRRRIEQIFDELLSLRSRIAANANLPDYRAYAWKAYKRFDYSPEQCARFADAIEATVVPLVRRIDRRRRADLGVDRLRPWDIAVDPRGRPPLRPFPQDQIPVFVEKTGQIFRRLSPALAEQFDVLRTHNTLDLESRKAKQPGGYQSMLEESGLPFIFMNAAGLQGDVETLLHEGGHAFHALSAHREPILFLRHAPMEFCEVASMSMELLGAEHLDVFYPDAQDVARARRSLLEHIIRFMPWMAVIDSFQHWLYTHNGHTPEQRQGAWVDLMNRFAIADRATAGDVDWSGYEAIHQTFWQRQLHLFHAPFYYIEYGIAQLGALQIWVRSRQNAHQALSNYRAALALGGTRTLPELFAAAGIQFDFSEKTLRPLIGAVEEELASL